MILCNVSIRSPSDKSLPHIDTQNYNDFSFGSTCTCFITLDVLFDLFDLQVILYRFFKLYGA